MPQKKEIVYCGIGKRIGAFIIDILCTLLIAINLNNYVMMSITSNILGTAKLQEQYKERLVDSHLYIQKENGLCYSIDIINDNNAMNAEEYINYLDEKLTLFYTDEDFEYSNIEYYNNLKKEATNIFVYNEETNKYEYLENVSINEKLSFYKNAVANTIDKVLYNDPQIIELTNSILKNNITSLIFSFIISMIIFFLVIPLISKNGSTIGKYMFKIGVIDLKTKQIAFKGQTSLRFIIILLEVLLSLMSFGGVLLISFSFTIFTKNNSALHDLVCKTTLVDLKQYKLPPLEVEEGELVWH